MYYNLRYCYFIFSFEYVLTVDLIAYVVPICLLIYFQLSIYLALKSKKNLIKPIQQKNRLLTKLISNENRVTLSSITPALGPIPTNLLDTKLDAIAQENTTNNNYFYNKKQLNDKKISHSFSEDNGLVNEVNRDLNKKHLDCYLERKGSGEFIKTSSMPVPAKTSAVRTSSVNQKTANAKEKFVKALRFRIFKTQLNLINQQIILTNNYTKNK